jgi:serine/threonine-protein kinase
MHLQHANVVGVFDIGMADTAYFIVMEYVDGANLKTILESLRRQGKKMPIAEVLYVMMEACKGLHYAHELADPETGRELGIVHRDISPPNILISKRGEVKLVDFGLAKATSQLESTDPGVVKGKFSYLSPEAASGKDVDRRADVFAVGILLYELLTGKRLFYGETDYQTVELVRQGRVPPIAAQNPEVLPELEQVVRKALARDVGSRFQSAADLQDALAQVLFSQRLKVTSRDIEKLVKSVLEEKQRSQPNAHRPVGNLIDTLINEEILKFTSLDDINDPSVAGPVPPTGDTGNAPLDPGLFVDTRDWADDLAPVTGPRRANGAGPRRKEKDPSGVIETGLEDLLEGDGSSPSIPPMPPPATSRTTGKRPAYNPPSSDAPTAMTAMPSGERKRGGGLVAVLVLVLALASVGAAVYLWRPELLGLKATPSERR